LTNEDWVGVGILAAKNPKRKLYRKQKPKQKMGLLNPDVFFYRKKTTTQYGNRNGGLICAK
jgi:hypothetical protein